MVTKLLTPCLARRHQLMQSITEHFPCASDATTQQDGGATAPIRSYPTAESHRQMRYHSSRFLRRPAVSQGGWRCRRQWQRSPVPAPHAGTSPHRRQPAGTINPDTIAVGVQSFNPKATGTGVGQQHRQPGPLARSTRARLRLAVRIHAGV